jgi:hypothetical protein
MVLIHDSDRSVNKKVGNDAGDRQYVGRKLTKPCIVFRLLSGVDHALKGVSCCQKL